VLDALQRGGVTDEEVSFGKELIKGNTLLSLESTGYRMSCLAMNEMFLSRLEPPEAILDRVDAVTRTKCARSRRRCSAGTASRWRPSGTCPMPAFLSSAMGAECPIRVRLLRAGDDALPVYQTDGSRRDGPESRRRRGDRHPADGEAMIPTGIALSMPAGVEGRCGRAAAWRSATA